MIDRRLSGSQNGLRFSGSRGQTLVEYALIIPFICVVAIASLLAMGSQVSGTYTSIDRQLNNAQNGGETAPARH
jgi:Flp pilus assembly pilin Flp